MRPRCDGGCWGSRTANPARSHAPHDRQRSSRSRLAARVYLPPASSTSPVTLSRIKVPITSWRSCRPASASTMAALDRGMPSASSPRTSGATLATMALISAEPVKVLAFGMRLR